MIVCDTWYNNGLSVSVCGMLIIKWLQGELLPDVAIDIRPIKNGT